MFIDDYAFRELPRPRFAELERTLSSCTSAAIEVNAVAIVGSDGLLPWLYRRERQATLLNSSTTSLEKVEPITAVLHTKHK